MNFQSFLKFPTKVAKYDNSVKKQEKGRQLTYSTENKTIWGARALEEK